jgi:FkbM family methyltransferase
MLRNLWSHFVSLTAHMAGLRKERDHHFYQGVLCPSSLVVDLGLHKGQFSRFVISEYGCFVIGLEANPYLFERLEAFPQGKFINFAINNQDSPVVFNVSNNPEASSVLEEMVQSFGASVKVTVPGITLDSLFENYSITTVDLLKVDIEGSEFDMLMAASEKTLAKVAQITVEFHLKPESADFSLKRILSICQRLGPLGFRVLFMDRDFTDVLFLNSNRIPLRLTEKIAFALYAYIIMPFRILTKKRDLGYRCV